MSTDYHTEESIERELEQYRKILQKLKEKSTEQLSKPKPSKTVCLSNLPSPHTNRSKELSNYDDVQNLLGKCSTYLIEYGKKVLP